MRFNINLATQPHEDVRRFFLRWTIGLLALAVISIGLIYAALISYLSWRVTARDIASVRSQIAERDRQRAEVEAFLNRPENRETRNRSQFLNALIARKAFSWTEVFNDLEKIMPPRLRVYAIRPEVSDDNQLELHLEVVGSSRDSANDLVHSLEQSPHFQNARMDSESRQAESQNQPVTMRFQISAIYLPSWSVRRAQTPAAPQSPAKVPNSSAAGKGKPKPAPPTSAQTEARNAGH